jgi:RNA polymerase sigma-32 factor
MVEKTDLKLDKPKLVHAELVEEPPENLAPLSESDVLADLDAEQTSETSSLTTSDPVSLYLAEIRKYPLLTREQEQRLAEAYHTTKDTKAAEALVKGNLRFVVKVAAEYTKFGAKLIDLIQEGNVGLLHAVKEYNPYKGVRLITYAVWWIRGYIQDYLMRQYSMVRIGTTQAQRKLFYRLQKERQALERAGQDGSDVKLLSTRLGVTPEDVTTMQQRLRGRDISLDQPLADNSMATLLDREVDGSISAEDQYAREQLLAALRTHIERIRPSLNKRELYILENRLLADEPMTLQEVGDIYGITREAVRQLEGRLIDKIRKLMLPTDQS